MTIRVQANAARARAQLAEVTAQTDAMAAAAKRASMQSVVNGSQIPRLIQFGNRIQWTGRQIQYNFTLPILLAAGAATKFALDNQKATATVVKVYGDQAAAVKYLMKQHQQLNEVQANTRANQIFRGEIDALGKSFEAISNKYAVQRKDVIGVAAAWAAAGVSGVALARDVQETMKAVIIGDMDATAATKSLISIQAQYRLSAGQLNFVLAQMNAIENQTAVSMPDLITAFARTAGTARQAGIDTRYLGAMIAALVPSSGSAAAAGNALKTIISRLLAPTKQVTEALSEMGIQVDSVKWQSASATDRINMLAGAWKDMTPQARVAAASILAGRYQINRFATLMDEVNNKTSFYNAALAATSNRQQVFTIAQRELNTVLSSNPQKLKQIWTILQNALADVITPMIPYLIYLADTIKNMVLGFSHLNPSIQKVALGFLLLLAVVGPLLRYFGSTITLLVTLGKMFKYVGVLLLSWEVILAAVLIAIYIFRDNILNVFRTVLNWIQNNMSWLGTFFTDLINGIVSGFNALPTAISNAMIAVVRVVRAAALAVYDWFSYLNPFAHHSPSVVENTQQGMQQVRGHYRTTMQAVQQHTKDAHGSVIKFNQATRQAGNNGYGGGFSQQGSQGGSFGIPSQLPISSQSSLSALRSFESELARVNGLLNVTNSIVSQQQQVVNKWQAALDHINSILAIEQNKLDSLQKTLQGYQDKLQYWQDQLSNYAQAPLKGLQEMENRIFRNQQAQNKLNLEMMKLNQATGGMDAIQQKLDAINGAQELLRGTQTSLRQAGAGSDILSQYDKQLGKLQKQKDYYQSQADEITKLQAKLDALQQQEQKLDLVKALRFDGLQRRIDQAANQMKELSFQQIMEGIRKSNKQIDYYQEKVNSATKAVARQQAIVDKLTKTRDAYQNKLNDEQKILDILTTKYQALTSAASGSGSGSSTTSLLPIGTGKGFPNVGGTGSAIRKNWESQIPNIDKFTQKLSQQTADAFGSINPFKGLGDAWDRIWKWIEDKTGPSAARTADIVNASLKSTSDALVNFGHGVKSFFTNSFFTSLGDGFAAAWRLLGPSLEDTLKIVENFGKEFITRIGAALTAFAPIGDKFLQVVQKSWPAVKAILTVITVILLGLIKVALDIVNGVLAPVLKALIDIITAALNIIANVIIFFLDLMLGDWKGALDALNNIALAILDIISALFFDVFAAIWGLVSGFVKGVVNFFKWLYDELVGHSIIPDMMKAIIFWFNWVVKPGIAIIKFFVTSIVNLFKILFNFITVTLPNAFKAGLSLAQVYLNGLKNFVINTWHTGIMTPFNALKSFILTTLPNAFKSGVGFIKQHWDNFKGIVESPVKFLINTVYDKGIVPVVNEVIHIFTLGKVDNPLSAIYPLGHAEGGLLNVTQGGKIPGTGFQDSELGYFMPNEYVIKQRYAKNLEKRMPGFLEKLNSGYVPGFAHGGDTGPGNPTQAYDYPGAIAWAKSQVGKPYIWGGVGPDGYDCSGFMSAITNFLFHRSPYSRIGSTANMPWPMFNPGPGAFTVGWTPNWDGTGIGHTAGSILGVNVESYGGHGPAVGSGALSPFDHHFTGLMHLGDPGEFRGSGGNSGWAHYISEAMSLPKKIYDLLGEIKTGMPGGGAWGNDVEQLANTMVKASYNWVKGEVTKGIGDLKDISGSLGGIGFGGLGGLFSLFDNGGYMPPGPAYNGTGKPEAVFTETQWGTLRSLVTAGTEVYNPTHENGGDTYNFYGDLSFPNIKNGDDADEFLKNLKRFGKR